MAKAKYSYNSKRKEWSTLAWDGTYRDGIKHRIRITSKKSSADLERKVNEFRRSVENGGQISYSAMSFYEYALHWLEISKTAKEKNTQAMYRNVIEKHLSFLDDVNIADIRHSHCQQAINNQLDHPRLCEQIKLTFDQIVKMAVRDRLLPRSAIDDVLSGVSLPKYQTPEKRPLNEKEKEALQKVALDPRKCAFVNILFYCGLRRQEALALTRFDFDWKAKTVNINKVVIFDRGKPEIKNYPKSDHGLRKVPIPAEAVHKIRPYTDSCPDAYLFHSRNSELMTSTGYKRMWSSIVCQLNQALGYNPYLKGEKKMKQGDPPITDLTAHIFRHNYCTQLCYQVPAISTKMIAKLLGDTEKMVLNVYSHIVEEKENITSAIEKAMAL